MKSKTGILIKSLVILVLVGISFTPICLFGRDYGRNSEIKTGMASWYGKDFNGKITANGERFNQNLLTCASNQYALGTWLLVTNLKNGKSVVVKVNDRMHPRMKRVVDLSKQAGVQIGIDKSGISKVKVQNLGRSFPADF